MHSIIRTKSWPTGCCPTGGPQDEYPKPVPEPPHCSSPARALKTLFGAHCSQHTPFHTSLYLPQVRQSYTAIFTDRGDVAVINQLVNPKVRRWVACTAWGGGLYCLGVRLVLRGVWGCALSLFVFR